MFGAIATEAGELPGARRRRRRQRRRHPPAVPRRHLRPHHRRRGARAHPRRRRPPSPSWPGCSGPAARSPSPCRRGCPSGSAGRCPTSTTPRSSRAATSASTPRPSCATQLRDAGLEPGGAHHAHALHSPYWWLKCAVGPTNDDHPLVQAYHAVLLWDIDGRQPWHGSPSSSTGWPTRSSEEPRRLRPEAGRSRRS